MGIPNSSPGWSFLSRGGSSRSSQSNMRRSHGPDRRAVPRPDLIACPSFPDAAVWSHGNRSASVDKPVGDRLADQWSTKPGALIDSASWGPYFVTATCSDRLSPAFTGTRSHQGSQPPRLSQRIMDWLRWLPDATNISRSRDTSSRALAPTLRPRSWNNIRHLRCSDQEPKLTGMPTSGPASSSARPVSPIPGQVTRLAARRRTPGAFVFGQPRPLQDGFHIFGNILNKIDFTSRAVWG